MKFRKRIQVLPGVTLNLSKSGFSTTVGVRGASVNVGRNGAFLNTGIAGTGIYDRKKINFNGSSSKPQRVQSVPRQAQINTIKPIKNNPSTYRTTPGNRQTSNLEKLTPPEMSSFLVQLNNHLTQRLQLKKEYEELMREELNLRRLERLSKWLIYGWFYKGHSQKIEDISKIRKEVLEDWENAHFAIDSNINEQTSALFEQLLHSYNAWTNTHKIWDIVSQFPNHEGCYDFERQEIKLKAQFFEGVQRSLVPLYFKNTFGTCLYVYQEFILVSRNETLIAVAPLDSLQITFEEVDFPEKSTLPNDAEIVGQTWEHVTKNGEPDRRYKHNPAISICRYALIHFTTPEGMLETFMCSDIQKTKALVEAFVDYIENVNKLLP